MGITNANGARRGGDDHRTLSELGFQVFDLLIFSVNHQYMPNVFMLHRQQPIVIPLGLKIDQNAPL